MTRLMCVEFLLEDRNAEIAGMDSEDADHLQNGENLVARDSEIERSTDVPPYAGGVHVGSGSVDRDAEEFDELRREDARSIGVAFIAMNCSVHSGSQSDNLSHKGFQLPSRRMASRSGWESNRVSWSHGTRFTQGRSMMWRERHSTENVVYITLNPVDRD